jgi:hypothetical protein
MLGREEELMATACREGSTHDHRMLGREEELMTTACREGRTHDHRMQEGKKNS